MEIEIKKYSNGSYSFWSEKRKRHENIPSDLAEMIINITSIYNANLLDAWHDGEHSDSSGDIFLVSNYDKILQLDKN